MNPKTFEEQAAQRIAQLDLAIWRLTEERDRLQIFLDKVNAKKAELEEEQRREDYVDESDRDYV